MPKLDTNATLNGDSITVTVEGSNGDTESINISDGSNTYNLSNVSSDSSQYRISLDISGNARFHSADVYDLVSAPSAPQNVSTSVDSNDQITLTWDEVNDWGGDVGSYNIEMRRDGGTWVSPAGGPTNVSGGSSSYSKTYGPNSDNSYGSQVGIDSSFEFRVLATNSDGDSSWSYSSTVYTDPIPPRNPTVTRPSSTEFTFDAEMPSDIYYSLRIEYREDTGSGYGSWNRLYSAASGALPVTLETGTGYDYGAEMQEDARYQFRMFIRSYNGANGRQNSESVFMDYGNSGNVYFEDDFEDQDLAEWDSTTLSDADSGIASTSVTDLGISGADDGTYYCRLDAGDYIQESLGDLSAESDVIVKATVATGSMDSSSESNKIQWYDGSAWQTLQAYSHEYNRQGWTEVTALVPSSYLSTDNRVRFKGDGAGDDMFAVDRVVVSDILHEYTKPDEPTSLSLDTTVEDEITVNWTDNAQFNYKQEMFWSDDGGSTWSQETYWSSDGESYSITGLKDGEEYTIRVRPVIRQPRHGSINNWWYKNSSTTTGITVLPAPSQLSADQIAPKSVDISWVNHHDNGTMKVQYKKSSNTAWNDFSTGLGTSVNSEEITGLSEATQYDARVFLSTEHKNHEDVVVSNNEKITVQSPYVVDSKDVVRGNLTIQE